MVIQMTEGEEKEKGNLTVTLNYIKIGQAIKAAIHFLNKILDILEIAAINKGAMERERRNGDRRMISRG